MKQTVAIFCKCPICQRKSSLLNKRRYFCKVCCIEFTTDKNGNTRNIFNISKNGDIKEIPK